MKKIYLQDENYNWKEFHYNDISGLKIEFEKRKITIGNYARIGDYAKIGDSAKIGYSATIGDKIDLLTGFYINGTRNTITYCGNNMLSIGCICLKISNLKKNFKKIGEENDYTKEQIEEYKNYILLSEKFAKCQKK